MPLFETLVRPFAVGDVTPARLQTTGADDVPGENLILRIGLNGTVKTLSGSSRVEQHWYMIAKEKETCGARDVHTKTVKSKDGRVEVDIEVIDKLKTKRGRGQAYQETETKYCNPNPNDSGTNPNDGENPNDQGGDL